MFPTWILQTRWVDRITELSHHCYKSVSSGGHYRTTLSAQSGRRLQQKKTSSPCCYLLHHSLKAAHTRAWLKILHTFFTDLVKVVSNDLPNPRPLQPDAVHVVVGNFHDLLQAEHSGLVCRGQLVHGHRTQPPHKVHWKQSHSNTVNNFCYF